MTVPLSARPRVLLNCATSLDGRLNPSPSLRKGDFMMSRHAEDPKRMKELRGGVDAILIGANNLRLDDPDLAIPEAEHASRRAAGQAEPLRIVITRHGAGLGRFMKMFDPALGGEAIVAHSGELTDEARVQLSPVATLVHKDLPELLRWLKEERRVKTLLSEGGGILNGALFSERAVDEMVLTLCPRILGGDDAPTLVAGPGFAPDEIPDATLSSVEHLGDELFLRYQLSWS